MLLIQLEYENSSTNSTVPFSNQEDRKLTLDLHTKFPEKLPMTQ